MYNYFILLMLGDFTNVRSKNHQKLVLFKQMNTMLMGEKIEKSKRSNEWGKKEKLGRN